MASPQVEDGYFRIANELAEALARHHPSGASGQVLWAILRKTYGWNKRRDSISIMQLMEFCGISRRSAIYALQDLEAKNMIFIERSGSRPSSITFNKDYDSWVVQNFAPQTEKNRQNARLRKNKGVQNFAPPGDSGNGHRNIQENQGVQNFARCKTLSKTDEVLHPQKTINKKQKTYVDFDLFWEAYPARGEVPRKQGKDAALKAWTKLANRGELPEIDEILRSIELSVRSWSNPKYIPMASTWLNGKRWQDEICSDPKTLDGYRIR